MTHSPDNSAAETFGGPMKFKTYESFYAAVCLLQPRPQGRGGRADEVGPACTQTSVPIWKSEHAKGMRLIPMVPHAFLVSIRLFFALFEHAKVLWRSPAEGAEFHRQQN